MYYQYVFANICICMTLNFLFQNHFAHWWTGYMSLKYAMNYVYSPDKDFGERKELK